MNHRVLFELASFLLLAGCQASGDVLSTRPGETPPGLDAEATPDSSGPVYPGDAGLTPDSSGPPVEQDATLTPDSSPASPDGATLSCDTAPTIVPQDYDRTCDTDTDCVAVVQGGSACDPCSFICPTDALTANGAAQFNADYHAALDAYAPLNVGKGCVLACVDFAGPCCRNRECVMGNACQLDAAASD